MGRFHDLQPCYPLYVMRTPKTNFLCYSNKFISQKPLILNIKLPVNMRKSSDNRPILRKNSSVSVPLWHNKDKSENPCVATGWRFVLILFPPKTALKRGLREGVKNQGCT